MGSSNLVRGKGRLHFQHSVAASKYTIRMSVVADLVFSGCKLSYLAASGQGSTCGKRREPLAQEGGA